MSSLHILAFASTRRCQASAVDGLLPTVGIDQRLPSFKGSAWCLDSPCRCDSDATQKDSRAPLQGGGTPRHQPLTRRCLYAVVAVVVALGFTLAVSSAHAQAGDGEVHLGLGPTFNASPSFASRPRGPGAQLSVFYGLNASWSVGTVVGVAGLYGGDIDDDRQGERFGAFVGPSFNFDVLEIIPYVSLAPGLIAAPGGLAPAARGAVGIDWRPRRQWAIGMQFEWQAALPRFVAYPSQSVVWLRFSWIVDTGRW